MSWVTGSTPSYLTAEDYTIEAGSAITTQNVSNRDRVIDIGQTVAASFQAPTLFTIAQDLTKMQVQADVDQSDIGRMKVGEVARFSVDAYPEQGSSHRLGRVEQVIQRPGQVRSGDRGELRVFVQ